MELIYINRIASTLQASFASKLVSIAQALDVDPNWLMQVMKAESGLNPQAVNKQPGDSNNAYERAAKRATGLIQFMPGTAKALGTNNQAIYKMNALQQLDLVYKYFFPWKGKMKSYYDVYAVVFFPAVIGKSDSWILQTPSTPAETIAKQNPAINKNKDGVITVKEFKQYVESTVDKSVFAKVFSVLKNNAGTSATIIVIIAATVFFYPVTKIIEHVF